MVDDIVTRLNYFWQSDLYCDPEFTIQLCDEAADEIERLRAAIDAVADLHEPDHTNEPRCLSCGDWPCLTHLILCNECKEARRG